MEQAISVEATRIRGDILRMLNDEHGALSVLDIAGRLGIKHNRAKYNILVLEANKKVRRIDGAAGVFYEINKP